LWTNYSNIFRKTALSHSKSAAQI